MSFTVHSPRLIDIGALGFAASLRGNADDGYDIEADVDAKTLAAAVKAAPDAPDPFATSGPTVEDQIAEIKQAITKATDFAAMKADLASSDVSAVDEKAAAVEAKPAAKT